MSFKTDIISYIKAGFPALWVTTHEEERAEHELSEAAKEESLGFWRWSHTQGWASTEGAAGEKINMPKPAVEKIVAMPNEAMYVMRDFHAFLTPQAPPDIKRMLRDVIPHLKSKGKMLVILSPVVEIPVELEKEITVVPFALPTREELGAKLDSVVEEIGKVWKSGKPEVEDRDAMLDAASGLTSDEAENAFALAWAKTRDDKARKLGLSAVRTVRSEKASAIKKSGLAEWLETDLSIDDVGGLGNVKKDLKIIAPLFHNPEKAKAFGFRDEDFPRSIALVGVPGTGKTLIAMAIAKLLNVGCVHADLGRIFSAGGGRVGAAEGNAERLLKTVEAVAPCEFFVDEMEKALAGSGGASTANPWEARIGATFLTWFESYRARILTVGTVNRTEQLPPEMFNRFQRVYFVDLPNEDELVEIFTIHLRMRNIKLDDEKVRRLAIKSLGYNGREIRNVVQAAMQAAFAAGEKSVSYDRLVEGLESVTPISVSRAAEVNAIKKWAKDNKIRPASAGESEAASPAGRRMK